MTVRGTVTVERMRPAVQDGPQLKGQDVFEEGESMRPWMSLWCVFFIAACGEQDGGGDSAGSAMCTEAPECPEGENEYISSDTPCGEGEGGCREVTACGETIYCRATGV